MEEVNGMEDMKLSLDILSLRCLQTIHVNMSSRELDKKSSG